MYKNAVHLKCLYVHYNILDLQKKIQKILSNIDNNKKCFWANQHITVISEGSCDTEAWSNDAENLALRHRKKNTY